MELWQAVILGLVEGVTEYLPVSSTGHLILAASLMGLDTPELKRTTDDFLIVIQGGAILAVLGLYAGRVIQMLKGLIGKDREGLRLAINIVIAFIPAAVIGLLLEDYIDKLLFHPVPVLAALALGGVYMIALDRWRLKRMREEESHGEDPASEARHGFESLTPLRALMIGLMQVVALIPGTSRSMMTITGGVLVGLRPARAAEFSFLLGLPTLGGATLYKLAKNLYEADKNGEPNLFETFGVVPAIVGVAVATVSAAFAVKWLVGFLNRHGLAGFGWYRIALAAVLGVLIWGGVVGIGGEEPGEPVITSGE